MSRSGQLLESLHFASASIYQLTRLLKKGWKQLALLLDCRTQVLILSVTFHDKVKQVSLQMAIIFDKALTRSCFSQFVNSASNFSPRRDDSNVYEFDEEDDLLISKDESLYEQACLNYAEVHLLFTCTDCLKLNIFFSGQLRRQETFVSVGLLCQVG